ncbi:MAG: hypothetical protein IPO90_01845 [Flavobacteriales bacterium]|nr:hypothetical protein [Flavobacteriales bacterium]
MCLKEIGVHLPLMAGTRPGVKMTVLYNGQPCHSAPMQRSNFPVPRDLPPHFRAVLAQDQRKRGERRPRRLVLGRFDPWPYAFYSLRLPGKGLHFPEGTLRGHLALHLYVELYDPMFDHAVLFHLRGSDPVPHPFNHVRWVAHKHWTPYYMLGGHTVAREETPCGCGVRVKVEF